MTVELDVGGLFRALAEARIEYVLIGGMAVNAHGVIRATKDVDICPSPDPANLDRLAELLALWDVRQLGVGDGGFAPDELPFDPRRADDLAHGGNFRLQTPLGVLDLMQWIPGIESDHAYDHLASGAQIARAFDVDIKVCSLSDLRAMKESAGRPRDLQDLTDLAAAHPDEH